jgi:hypothetical protein
VWALEEYEDPEPLREKIRDASLSLRVSVDGEIVSQTGGVRQGDTVLFEVSLVELLTLSGTDRYAVEFR